MINFESEFEELDKEWKVHDQFWGRYLGTVRFSMQERLKTQNTTTVNFQWIGLANSTTRVNKCHVFMFIDHDEIKHLRKTEHERPIGRTEEGEDILSHLGTVVQQFVGLAGQPSPEDIEKPPQIIGISKSIDDGKENWIISRPFFPEWIKSVNFEQGICCRSR